MLRRDDYLRMLEKRASDFDGGKTGPTYDHDVNSAEVAISEHKSNLNDNRATLGTLFTNMDEAKKVETRFAKKWFPSEKFDKDTSSPLIKVAMETLAGSTAFRNYAPHVKAAAIRSFTDELEKIGSAVGTGAVLGGVGSLAYDAHHAATHPHDSAAKHMGSSLKSGVVGMGLGAAAGGASHLLSRR